MALLHESTTTFPAQANGDVVVLITGRLVEQVTNVNTGKSITINISGPETAVAVSGRRAFSAAAWIGEPLSPPAARVRRRRRR
jgi:hypothetical protein